MRGASSIRIMIAYADAQLGLPGRSNE